MQKVKYSAEYHSSTGQCVKRLATQYREDMAFHPQVLYSCDICKSSHGFRLFKTWALSTPNAIKQFESYCTNHHIESDVKA